MLNDFISMIFPACCLACSEPLPRNAAVICPACQYHLPRTDYHLTADNPLVRKFWGRVPFKYVLAYLKFTKQGRVQQLLHKLKYEGYQEIGSMLGRWYAAELKQAGFQQEFDVILPVPLHESKLRSRGYNQCDSFAAGMAEVLGISRENRVLSRVKATVSQTTQQRSERWQNVENTFAVAMPEKISGKHVLLVDDVITTGATIEACASVLLEHNCASLSVASIASA